MKRFILLSLLMIFALHIAAIEVSGNQSGTWSADNNPYQIIGDITVPIGQILTIEPGVIVQAMGNFRINAEGSIQAIGTETDSIYFYNAQDPPTNLWKGIRLENDSVESEFTHCYIEYAEYGINAVDSPIEVSYCHFSHNQRGLHLYGIGNLDPAPMNVHHNLIEYTVQNGILIPQNSNAWVHHNELRYNGTGTQYYGTIQLANQSAGGQNNPIIEHNYIHNNQKQGITAWDVVGASAINPTIRYNHIEANLTGIYLLNASGIVHNNTIINNFIPGDANSGAGMMISGATSLPYVAENILTGNFTAFYITTNALPVLGDLSENHPWAYGQNVIQDNIDGSGTMHSVVCASYSASENVIMAQNNDWGVYTADEIAIGITDQVDNPSLPLVHFEPWYEESPAQTITGSYSWNPDEYSDIAPGELKLLLLDAETRETIESHVLSGNPFEISSEVSADFFALLTAVDEEQEIWACPGALDDPQYFEPGASAEIDLGDIYIDAWQQYQIEQKGEPETISGREIWPVYKGFLLFPYDTVDYFYDEGDYRYIYKHEYFADDEWHTVDFGFGQTYEKLNDLVHSHTWEQHYVEDGEPVQYIVGINIDDAGERTYVTMDQSWNILSQRYLGDDYERIYLYEDGVTSRILEVHELSENVRFLYHHAPPLGPSDLRIRTDHGEERSVDLQLWWTGPEMDENQWEGYRLYWQKEGEAPEMYTQIPIFHNSWNLWGVTGNGTYSFWMVVTDGEHEFYPSNTVMVTLSTANEDLVQQPSLNIYPNPVSFSRDGQLKVAAKGFVRAEINIYNIRGQKVISAQLGEDEYRWDGRDDKGNSVSSGIYLMRVEDARKRRVSRKIVITK